MDIKNLGWRERIRDNRKTKEVLGSVVGNVKYFRSWESSKLAISEQWLGKLECKSFKS